MKNISKLSPSIFLTLVSLSAGAEVFGVPNTLGDKAMSDVQKQTDQDPYPFTAEELWEKLLKVVELPDGYITREQVESIFGVTLTLAEENPDPRMYRGKRYQIKENSYFDMYIIENGPMDSTFFFGWGNIPGQRPAVFPRPPAGMCIDAYKNMPSIVQRDWELKRETRRVRDIPDNNIYRKGNMGVLTIGFSPLDNCLLSIRISVTKNADLIVR